MNPKWSWAGEGTSGGLTVRTGMEGSPSRTPPTPRSRPILLLTSDNHPWSSPTADPRRTGSISPAAEVEPCTS